MERVTSEQQLARMTKKKPKINKQILNKRRRAASRSAALWKGKHGRGTTSETPKQETAWRRVWFWFLLLFIISYYTLVLRSTTVTAELSHRHTHNLCTNVHCTGRAATRTVRSLVPQGSTAEAPRSAAPGRKRSGCH